MINPSSISAVRQRMLIALGVAHSDGIWHSGAETDSDRRVSRRDQCSGAGARDSRRNVAAGGRETRHATNRNSNGWSAAADRNSIGLEDRFVRHHDRFRRWRERLLRAAARLRAAGKRTRRICRPVSMSNWGRLRPASAKFSNTRSSARTRKNTTRPSCAPMQDYIVRPILRTRAGSYGCEFIRRTGEAIPGHRQTRAAHSLQSHACSRFSTRLEKNNANASGNLHRTPVRAIRRARPRLGERARAISRTSSSAAGNGKHERPIYVRDVADVKIGAELRQGAVTANGEGEAVAGIVLMLKGASGRDVVNAVKEKLPAIQKGVAERGRARAVLRPHRSREKSDPHSDQSAGRKARFSFSSF